MPWSNVLFMELISDIGHATAVAGSVCAELQALRCTEFWKIGDKDLLTLAETLERVGRLVFAAQVHLTGELDSRGVAGRSCPATCPRAGRPHRRSPSWRPRSRPARSARSTPAP